MISATSLRRGMIIRKEKKLFSVFSAIHHTPGNKRGFIQTKLRNLETGAITDYRFRSVDNVEKVALDQQDMEYLYNDGNDYYFMNIASYEQIHLDKKILGDNILFLSSNIVIKVDFYDENPVGIQIPNTVELEVTETEPGLKTATASSVNKPAKLETGLIVQVPIFINTGEKIRIDTNEGTYLERVR